MGHGLPWQLLCMTMLYQDELCANTPNSISSWRIGPLLQLAGLGQQRAETNQKHSLCHMHIGDGVWMCRLDTLGVGCNGA